jgi:phosphatidylglycerophosphate synthase
MVSQQTANLITLSRLGFIPLFMAAAILDAPTGFAILLLTQGGLDWLDGWVARRWQITSDFGRRLDSLIDFPVWVVGFGAFFYLIRQDPGTIWESYRIWLVTPFITYGLMQGAALYLTGHLSTMHLYTAKFTAVLVFAVMLLTLLDEFPPILGYATVISALIFHLEATLIYLIQKQDADENLTSIIEVLRKT